MSEDLHRLHATVLTHTSYEAHGWSPGAADLLLDATPVAARVKRAKPAKKAWTKPTSSSQRTFLQLLARWMIS